jgi:ABC-2 type transport system permease protein
MFGTVIVGLCMGISISITQLLLIIVLSPLMCLSAGSLAMIIIGTIKSNKTANIAVSLITMPQMFLSGAIIPITNSHGILYVISRMLPMTYCIDLVRSVVYAGTAQYKSVVINNPAIDLVVIVAITVVCLVIGTFFFARSEKNR